jgi:cystathionine beta-lyase/cystathionine gamma-synthase
MTAPRESKTHIGNHRLHPETLMLNYGYDPALSEGAVKPPVFLTSTFVFPTAEDGRDFFDYASGRKEPPRGRGGASSIRASTTPMPKSSRTGWRSMRAPRPRRCFPRACRRSARHCWPS